jgi:hypothetical protein
MITDLNKKAQFTEQFLKEYIEKGFGSISKKEIDLLVFHLLSKLANLDKISNYNLALKLKLTPTKIKNLRFERSLKYSQLTEKEIKESFIESLKKSAIKVNKTSSWIILSIEDLFVREAIKAKLKDLAQLSDSSFNSEIITLDFEAFASLMEYFYDEEIKINSSKIKEILEYLKAETSNKNEKISFKHLFREFANGAANKAGEETMGITFSFLTGGISDISNIFNKINKKSV